MLPKKFHLVKNHPKQISLSSIHVHAAWHQAEQPPSTCYWTLDRLQYQKERTRQYSKSGNIFRKRAWPDSSHLCGSPINSIKRECHGKRFVGATAIYKKHALTYSQTLVLGHVVVYETISSTTISQQFGVNQIQEDKEL